MVNRASIKNNFTNMIVRTEQSLLKEIVCSERIIGLCSMDLEIGLIAKKTVCSHIPHNGLSFHYHSQKLRSKVDVL